ncbi:MAG TPA: 2-hydroxyacid dehydrogenase [Bacteroidia bacterium]|nr:2-hydroxyacid dehydrogenase [Bacteroidia bacterium]
MAKKILFLDSNHPSMLEMLRAKGFECDEDYSSPKEEIEKKLPAYQGVVIRSRFRIDQQFLDAGTSLECIGRAGAGMENIDADYAQSKGIRCVHAPEGNRVAVAEHALGMLLALLNNFLRADGEVRNGTWKREENRGTELTEKTVGIIGYGNMGSAFAKVLRGFDVTILAYDKYKTGFGSEYVKESSLEEIYAQADVLSLHIPLTDETQFMVNESFLRGFEKPIWLLNTSRGKVLDTATLVTALKNGKVLGAGLDVLEYEAVSFEQLNAQAFPKPFQELRDSDRVILSPHVAGWTIESHRKIAEVLAGKMIDVLQGEQR